MTRIDYAKAKRTGPTEAFNPNEITTAKAMRKLRGHHKGRAVQRGISARTKAAADRKAEQEAIEADAVIAPRVIRRDAAEAAEISASMMADVRRRSVQLDAERNPPPEPKPKKRRPNRRQRAKLRRERG